MRLLTSGVHVIRGSICFVDRSSEMLQVLELLPRLPMEMEFMELHKGKLAKEPRKFKVRVAVVKRALEWLLKYHPAYSNIKISVAKLEMLQSGLVGKNKDQIVLPRMQVPKGVANVIDLGCMGEADVPGKDYNPFEQIDPVGAHDHHVLSKVRVHTVFSCF